LLTISLWIILCHGFAAVGWMQQKANDRAYIGRL